jgi:hypothetical protein
MATFKLRRFASVDALKTIQESYLLDLLSPHETYFKRRGVDLAAAKSGGIDYDALVDVLANPDGSIPKELVDSLYYVHEMSTTEAMDDMLDEIGKMPAKNRITLDLKPEPTPADVAVQVWLRDEGLLRRKHAEHSVRQPRSFEYFQAAKAPRKPFRSPSAKTLAALEKDLGDWFIEKKRGREVRVFAFVQPDGVWFLVRHGDPYTRQGAIDKGESSSVYFRPEKHDVLVYDVALGELRANAASKGEKTLYREKFGLHLFGDENHFPNTGKYTLEPLRTDGEASLVCTDVDGMEWVKLKEIWYYWGGSESELEIRKAKDVFAALSLRKRTIPQRVRIAKASFLVKFEDCKTTRTVSIRPPNIAQYTRDDDGTVVEAWLAKRGFTSEPVPKGKREKAKLSVAST